MSSSPIRRATRADVARLANVSTTAVTAVLSGNCPNVSVSEATRERILSAAKDLNYRPNMQARGLKQRRSLLLAYLCREVYRRSHEIMVGMQAALEGTDYALVHFSRGDTLEAEARHLELCWDRGVDGILLTPMLAPDGRANLRQLLDLVERGVPIVELPNDTLPEVPSVTIDQAAAVGLCVDHLMELGHERIALVHPAEQPGVADPRRRMHPRVPVREFKRRMSDAGLEPITIQHASGLARWRHIETLLAHAPELAQRILDHPGAPTAVITPHDHVGVTLIRAWSAMGVSVPGTMSVIGMHNQRSGRLCVPALTTVEMHHERIGAAAAEAMHRQIEGETIVSRQIQPELIVRESTAPVSW